MGPDAAALPPCFLMLACPLASPQTSLTFYVSVSEFSIKRDPKYGGDKVYTVFEEVEKDFAEEVMCSFLFFLSVCAHLPNLI